MNKGFQTIHNERKVRVSEFDAFYKLANNDYEYPENVNFQYSDDNCIALPYGYFVSAHMKQANSIEIKYNGWEITIEGRNLKPVYNAFIERRLKNIRQADAEEIDSGDLKTFIKSISVKDLSTSPETDEN